MACKLFLCVLGFFIARDLHAQPVAFEENVEIHKRTLKALIDKNMFSNNDAIKTAQKYQVDAICRYSLAQYSETGSYTESLDFMRQMIRDAFVSDYDSVINIVDRNIAQKVYERYQEKNLLLNDG